MSSQTALVSCGNRWAEDCQQPEIVQILKRACENETPVSKRSQS
jgi:hypothetical protein